MTCTRVAFPALPWTQATIRSNARRSPARRPIALLEFAPGFADPNWCERSHVIFVLQRRARDRAARPRRTLRRRRVLRDRRRHAAPREQSRQRAGRPPSSRARSRCGRDQGAALQDGRVEVAGSASIRRGSTPDNAGVLWVDLCDPTPDEARLLSETFKFHELAIEDALAQVASPQGRVVRQLPLPDPARHQLPGRQAPVRDDRRRLLHRQELPGHGASRHDALDAVRARAVRKRRRARDARGAVRAGAPHHRQDGRSLSARGRRARREHRQARDRTCSRIPTPA